MIKHRVGVKNANFKIFLVDVFANVAGRELIGEFIQHANTEGNAFEEFGLIY